MPWHDFLLFLPAFSAFPPLFCRLVLADGMTQDIRIFEPVAGFRPTVGAPTVTHWQLRDLLQLHPSQPVLYTVSGNSVMKVFLEDTRHERAFSYNYEPTCLHVSSTGAVAVGGTGGTLSIDDSTVQVSNSITNNVFFDPLNPNRVYIGCNDSSIKLYDVTSSAVIKSVQFSSAINYVRVSDDGRFIAGISDTAEVHFVDPVSFQRTQCFDQIVVDAGFALSFDARCTRLAAASQHGEFGIIDLRKMAVATGHRRIPHLDCIRIIKFDPFFDGHCDMLAAAGHTGHVSIVDTRTLPQSRSRADRQSQSPAVGILQEIECHNAEQAGTAGVVWTEDRLYCAWSDSRDKITAYQINRRARRQLPSYELA